MSTVAHVMQKNPKKVAYTTSVRDAAKRMRDEQVGSLLVEKDGKLVGIVTDTDVVRRGVADGADLNHVAVESIMTAPLATIESIRTTQDAHDMMGDLHIRHLCVTESGTIVGVLSVRDLLVHFKRVSEPKIAQD